MHHIKQEHVILEIHPADGTGDLRMHFLSANPPIVGGCVASRMRTSEWGDISWTEASLGRVPESLKELFCEVDLEILRERMLDVLMDHQDKIMPRAGAHPAL